MKKITKELMGAISVPLILSMLQNSDTYGYRILKQTNELSKGKIIWKEGSLYPVLKRLEVQKLIKSYWNTIDFDRPRKYYKILPKGKQVLADYKEDFDLMNDIFNNLS